MRRDGLEACSLQDTPPAKFIANTSLYPAKQNVTGDRILHVMKSIYELKRHPRAFLPAKQTLPTFRSLPFINV